MPRKGKSRSRRLVASAKRRKQQENADELIPAGPPPREDNAHHFERFYRAQRVLGEEEWPAFMQALRRPLPLSFRLNRHTANRLGLRQCIARARTFGLDLTPPSRTSEPQKKHERKRHKAKKQREEENGYGSAQGPSVHYVDWADAYQFAETERDLEQQEELQGFGQWLADFTSLGIISRQEIVSMVPVAFLNIKPHHRVLDLCASPGSKTSQVLDALAQDPSAGGFVVANDADPKRAYTLVRRCHALGAACAKLLVTQHKAQKFPAVIAPRAHHRGSGHPGRGSQDPSDDSSSSSSSSSSTESSDSSDSEDGEGTDGQDEKDTMGAEGYDRIVCDVPCCGDGTLRKSPDMWRRWHPGFAVGLHTLQLQIAMRGLALLRVGGVMTYSTCTFNPIEDEAVVAQLLNRCGDSIELVDVSEQHASLIRRPGITHWKVFDDNMMEHASYDACMRCKRLSPGAKRTFRPGMWPPENASHLPLHRCMRLYPQDQDTGGFFVAVIRKVKPLPNTTQLLPRTGDTSGDTAAATKPTTTTTTTTTAGAATGPAHLQYAPAQGSATLHRLVKTFKLPKSFVKEHGPRLFCRSLQRTGALMLVSPALRRHAWALETTRALRSVAMGVKICERSGRHTDIRLTQTGCDVIASHARRQVVALPVVTVRQLLHNVNCFLPLDAPALRFSAVTKQFSDLKRGPCIIRVAWATVDDDDNEDDDGQRRSKRSKRREHQGATVLFLPAWFDKEQGRLKVVLHFSKGLELVPRAAARVLLRQLPSSTAMQS